MTRLAEKHHNLLQKYKDIEFARQIACGSNYYITLFQGSTFFISLFFTLILVQFTSKEKLSMQISSISSFIGFMVLSQNLGIMGLDSILTSQAFFGISSGINSTKVLEYLMKFLGSKFESTYSVVQKCETITVIAFAIILWSGFASEKLYTTGIIVSLISFVVVSANLVEYPISCEDKSRIDWIA